MRLGGNRSFWDARSKIDYEDELEFEFESDSLFQARSAELHGQIHGRIYRLLKTRLLFRRLFLIRAQDAWCDESKKTHDVNQVPEQGGSLNNCKNNVESAAEHRFGPKKDATCGRKIVEGQSGHKPSDIHFLIAHHKVVQQVFS